MLESLIKTIHPVSTGHGLVRIGNIGDGGYIVPDCIAGIECCLSPGTGWPATFELH